MNEERIMSIEKYNGCDVLLISPVTRNQWIYLPFSLLYLSSYLETKGISTIIIDLKKKLKSFSLRILEQLFKNDDLRIKYTNTVLDEIKKYRPLLVGLTCYTNEYGFTMELAQIIKEKINIPIVVGGVHATLRPQDFIFKGSSIDFAVVGEGETPLFKLVLALKNKSSLEGIEGVAYLKNDGLPFYDTFNVEEDISRFPMPDYNKIDMSFYIRPHTGHIRNLLLSGVGVITSRGCPYDCDFCAVNYLRSKNRKISKIRYRSIDQIIEEIELLVKKYKIDGFYVMDDCFMVSKERTIEFCENLIKRKLNLVWGATTRVNLINDEKLLKLMKKSGLLQLDFGVESGSPDMLRNINKGITVEQIKRAFSLCRKNNIRTFANIMFNLPNETKDDILLTEKLLNDIKPTVLGIALTVPLLGTKIYENLVFPKLTTSEYEIYNKNVYYKIIDKRFFLAKHDIDFEKLMARLNSKHNKSQSISFNLNYWKKILRSYYLSRYISAFFWLTLDTFARESINIDSVYFNSFFKKTIKNLFRKKTNINEKN